MSNLQITGTIKSIGEVQTGTSKTTNKEWKKRINKDPDKALDDLIADLEKEHE